MATSVYGYDKNTDYSKLMQEAVKKGDMARAAIYEAQRNEKIAGEGLTQYQATNQYASYLPGSYSGQGYQNPYLDELNAAIGRLQDGSAYKKAYLREADRTMQDTLGQYATMTGGIPSTQAVAAASQAADYYKSQLGERLTDLDLQNANLLLAAGSQAQSDYQMMISGALDRWSRLGYADDQVAQILGVAIGTPTTDQSYLNWQQGQQDKADAYTMAMTLLQAGQMPNADTLAAAGITAEDAQKLFSAYTTPVYSGGGGSYTTNNNDNGREPLTDEMFEELYNIWKSGDVQAFQEIALMRGRQGYNILPVYEFIYDIDPNAEELLGGYAESENAGNESRLHAGNTTPKPINIKAIY